MQIRSIFRRKRARDGVYTEVQQKRCRLVAVVGRGEEHSVSSRARCVWLTSRPSWPLEGGRPREVSRSRARYRLLGHARGPSSHHLRSNDRVHDTEADADEESGSKKSVYPSERETERVNARARACSKTATGTTAGDRIMFRYLYDAAHFGLPPATHEERGPRRRPRSDDSRSARLTCHCDRATAQLNRWSSRVHD